MTLTKVDRDLLRIWAEHGIPFDRSTVEAASGLIVKLFDETERLRTSISELSLLAEEPK